MLSSGMFARHQPHPSAPARRGGPARPCDSSVFPATSAISVLIPVLSPKNPSFVFIRLRTLSFSVYNIFPFKRFAFNPFRTLSRNGGVGINSSQSGTRHSALIPLQLIQVLSFHTLAHSLAQWAQHNPFGINSFRTLSIATGVWGDAGTFQDHHVSTFALLQFRRGTSLPAIWSLPRPPLCSPRCTPGTRVRPSSPPCSAPFPRPTESLREQTPAFSDRTG